jgi:dolichyl-phosphate-mannose-protein mannosyltransferase
MTKLAMALILVPIGVYFLTFLPYLFFHKGDGTRYALFDLIPMQLTMWKGQVGSVTPHPYMSKWTSWPLMTRPICYAFDKEGENIFRCVLLLGNPLIMWSGLLALIFCIWGWVAYRSREAFLILSFYAAFYLGWAFIPRNVSYYYYYYPAGMTLSLAIAFCFHVLESGKSLLLGKLHILRWAFLTACILIFIIFFPILSAVKVSLAEYHMRMWLQSWI